MERSDVDAAVEPDRAMVTADGGELLVDGVDDGVVTLRLVLEGAACRECVMPRSFLEQVATDMMRPSLGALERVAIIDPRED